MYKIYLNKILFPIAPSEIKQSVGNKNSTITLINEGEVNLLKSAGLKTVKFKLLLPSLIYPFAKYKDGFKPAMYYVNLLEKWKREKTVFVLALNRSTYGGTQSNENLRLKVTLEELHVTESTANGIDMEADLTLKEYRTFATKAFKVSKTTTTNSQGDKSNKTTVQETKTRDASGKDKAKSYTIKSGDTLPSISQTQFGNTGYASEIYQKNRTVIEDAAVKNGRASSLNGTYLYAGTVLDLTGIGG